MEIISNAPITRNPAGPRAHTSRGLIRFSLVIGVLGVLIFNRGASKVPVGPIFILDAVLLLGAMEMLTVVRREILNFRWAILVISLAIGWLLNEYANDAVTINALRRSAMAFYLLVPALVLAIGTPLYRFLGRNSVLLAIAICVASADSLIPNLQGTISAEVLAFLFIISVFQRGKFRVWKSVIIFLCFCLVASGITTNQSMYRTPLAGLIFSFGAAAGWAAIFGKRRSIRAAGRLISAALILSLITVGYAFSDNARVGQLIAAGAGVLGIAYQGPASQEVRERGDAAGTAETRVAFWTAVLSDSAQSLQKVAIGNGHSRSFFEQTRPYEEFIDEDVLEPHNSFIGIYYRYGGVGLVALLLLILGTLSLREARSDVEYMLLIAITGLAMCFAFFEVALEGPHGALIFWVMLCAPRFLRTVEGSSK